MEYNTSSGDFIRLPGVGNKTLLCIAQPVLATLKPESFNIPKRSDDVRMKQKVRARPPALPAFFSARCQTVTQGSGDLLKQLR